METLLEKYLTPDNITFMLQAAGVSVVIAALALTFGLCLGILGAAGRISKNKVAHGIATFYVETIRGTPMMLQILFFYLGVPSIVRSITGTPFNPSVYLIGVVALSINSGAYTTELIRSAIQAVDAGQWEASRTLGLGYRQMIRYEMQTERPGLSAAMRRLARGREWRVRVFAISSSIVLLSFACGFVRVSPDHCL